MSHSTRSKRPAAHCAAASVSYIDVRRWCVPVPLLMPRVRCAPGLVFAGSRFALAAVRGACPAPQRFSADSNADYKVTNTSATAVTARGGAVNLVVMERRLACLLFAAALAGVAGAGEPARAATTPTLKEAIARVERETAGKVLSAETRRAGKQTIYRIKV